MNVVRTYEAVCCREWLQIGRLLAAWEPVPRELSSHPEGQATRLAHCRARPDAHRGANESLRHGLRVGHGDARSTLLALQFRICTAILAEPILTEVSEAMKCAISILIAGCRVLDRATWPRSTALRAPSRQAAALFPALGPLPGRWHRPAAA